MRKIILIVFALLLCLIPAENRAEEKKTETFQAGDYRYTVNEDGTVTIIRWSGKGYGLEKEIPDKIDGREVTAIGDYAFGFCTHLKSLDIPDTVTYIGHSAFTYCILKNVNIPKSTIKIEDSAFQCCTDLMKIVIPGKVAEIGKEAFFDCTGLTEIYIPESVTVIGEGAFHGCDKVTIYTVTGAYAAQYAEENGIPYVLTDADRAAGEPEIFIKDEFRYFIRENGTVTICGLWAESRYLEIPREIEELPVTEIAESAFAGRDRLRSVVIPNTVTFIGDGAFRSCGRLAEICVPDTVMSIGEDAFSECDWLTLTVERNSYAWEYAVEKDIPYTYPDADDWLTR